MEDSLQDSEERMDGQVVGWVGELSKEPVARNTVSLDSQVGVY